MVAKVLRGPWVAQNRNRRSVPAASSIRDGLAIMLIAASAHYLLNPATGYHRAAKGGVPRPESALAFAGCP
jgi:hypothetical protein